MVIRSELLVEDRRLDFVVVVVQFTTFKSRKFDQMMKLVFIANDMNEIDQDDRDVWFELLLRWN